MRLLLTTLIFLGSIIALDAEDYHNWTEAETKRKIEAKIVDKKSDGSEAKLLMPDGKAVWIEKSRFIEQDQVYIQRCVKPIKHLTVKVVGTRKATPTEKYNGIEGWKRVEIIAVAGSNPITVRASRPRAKAITRKLKAGETVTFEHWTGQQYWVRAFRGDEMVDEETDRAKTGL